MHIAGIATLPPFELTEEYEIAMVGQVKYLTCYLHFFSVEGVFLIKFYLIKRLKCWPKRFVNLSGEHSDSVIFLYVKNGERT